MDHQKFMGQALAEAESALKNGEFPVGCVIVHNDAVVACGQRQHSAQSAARQANEIDHAEIIALRELLIKRPNIPPEQVRVYSTMEPCLMCYAAMLLNGVRSIIYAYEDVMGGAANLPLANLNPLYSEMQVLITKGILRNQSLKLFQQFFSSPKNSYWQDSLLSRYTLEQGL